MTAISAFVANGSTREWSERNDGGDAAWGDNGHPSSQGVTTQNGGDVNDLGSQWHGEAI